jgi:hypothetical protein
MVGDHMGIQGVVVFCFLEGQKVKKLVWGSRRVFSAQAKNFAAWPTNFLAHRGKI